MRTSRPRSAARLLLVFGSLVAYGSDAHADPLYNITDLGTGSFALATDANGNDIATDGPTTIPFALPQNLPPTPTTPIPNVEPAPISSPDTYGNPNFAFSYSKIEVMNSHGLAAGVDTYGVDGHQSDTTAFYVQRLPDGSWSFPVALWQGNVQFAGFGNYGSASIIGLSNHGQILGTGSLYNDGSIPPFNQTTLLYDVKTGSTTNLFNLLSGYKWTNLSFNDPSLPLPGPGANDWFFERAIGIDAQGRLLVEAGEGASGPTHTLLMTPEDPLSAPTPVPEPTTLAMFLIALGGVAARRRLKRNRESGASDSC